MASKSDCIIFAIYLKLFNLKISTCTIFRFFTESTHAWGKVRIHDADSVLFPQFNICGGQNGIQFITGRVDVLIGDGFIIGVVRRGFLHPIYDYSLKKIHVRLSDNENIQLTDTEIANIPYGIRPHADNIRPAILPYN